MNDNINIRVSEGQKNQSMSRAKAVESAMASMKMEGFIFTDEELAIFEKLANKEISYDDVKKIAVEKIKHWKKENPDFFTTEK